VFEEPVTEAIAPGYFDIVDKPMDYLTVEKKVEEQGYKDKDEVSSWKNQLCLINLSFYLLSLFLMWSLSMTIVVSIMERIVSTMSWLKRCGHSFVH